MPIDDRHPTYQQALRALRRGELLLAVALFERLAAEFPLDPGLRARLEALRESVLPMELQGAGAPAVPDLASLAPLERAEFHASSGDLEKASALYREALAQAPGNVLLQERLTELAGLERTVAPQHPARPKIDPEQALEALLSRLSMRRRK